MRRHSLAVVLLTFAIHTSCSSVFAQPAEPSTRPDSQPDIKVFLWEPTIVEGLTETEGSSFGEGRNAPRYYRYLRPGLVLQAGDVARPLRSHSLRRPPDCRRTETPCRQHQAPRDAHSEGHRDREWSGNVIHEIICNRSGEPRFHDMPS